MTKIWFKCIIVFIWLQNSYDCDFKLKCTFRFIKPFFVLISLYVNKNNAIFGKFNIFSIFCVNILICLYVSTILLLFIFCNSICSCWVSKTVLLRPSCCVFAIILSPKAFIVFIFGVCSLCCWLFWLYCCCFIRYTHLFINFIRFGNGSLIGINVVGCDLIHVIVSLYVRLLFLFLCMIN